MTHSIVARAGVLAATLLGCSAYLAHASHAEVIPIREPLESLSMSIDGWRGVRAPDFDARVMSVLGVDDYVNRIYRSATDDIGLYVGYYRSQRQGDAIHSPLNCLPGAGWQPTDVNRLDLDVRSANGVPRLIEVNSVAIQKGEDSAIALYWYQSHGRVIASEYWGKFYLVADAIRLNRTDAALVRIISPVRRDEPSSEPAAARAAAFAQAVFPLLDRRLPQ